jgi:hypothetical protein
MSFIGIAGSACLASAVNCTIFILLESHHVTSIISCPEYSKVVSIFGRMAK